MKPLTHQLLFLFLSGVATIGVTANIRAQTLHILTGLVMDAHTGEPVPFASVALVGRRVGTLTDEQGRFALTTKNLADSLAVSSLGYTTLRRAIDNERLSQAIDFKLNPAGNALREVTVRAGENPAFRVLRQVRKNRLLNDRNRLSAYECDSYVKTEVALSHVSDKLRRNPLIRRVNEAMSRQDSLDDDEGHRLLPMLASESVSRYYSRSNPHRTREEVRKTRIKGVAVDDAGLSSQLLGGTGLVNQNFYDNYIPILGKDFASPIGDNWKNWYQFFLADTTQIGDRICYEIQFDPKRPEDLTFVGKVWIDTLSFALCQIEARIGSGANLNYVRRLTIEQELEPTTDSASGSVATTDWLPVSLRLVADLAGKTIARHAGAGDASQQQHPRQPPASGGFLRSARRTKRYRSHPQRPLLERRAAQLGRVGLAHGQRPPGPPVNRLTAAGAGGAGGRSHRSDRRDGVL